MGYHAWPDTDVLRHFTGTAWGVATAGCLAAPALDTSESTADPLGHLQPSRRAARWADDMRTLGAATSTHRVLMGWQHLQPDGPGHWDRAALDRCDRRLDAMLDAGLRPALTLVHLDVPQWVDAVGGWLCRDSVGWFAEYAAEMGRRFGDRADRLVTFTDLTVCAVTDHVAGMCPPFRGQGLAGLPAVHHVLLAHGLGMQALRASGTPALIGAGLPLLGAYAAGDDPWDRIALERFEQWTARFMLDPLLLGTHLVTEDGSCPVADTGCVREGDMRAIAAAQDVLGLSWHAPSRVAAPENVLGRLPATDAFRALNEVNRLLAGLGFAVLPFDEVPTTRRSWPIIPEGLADALESVHMIYGDRLPPLWITDAGLGDDLDVPGPPDEIAARRRALLRARLGWVSRIAADRVDIRGYEYWSVLDNVEWVMRYVRLYGAAVPSPEIETLPQPAPPCDWVHTGAFAAPHPTEPARGVSLLDRQRGKRAAEGCG